MPQSSPAGTDPRTAAARWCAALLMAQFVSGRAVRDALYLANLPVTTLPTAMLVTAVASILLALVWPRLSSGTPPARFLSRARPVGDFTSLCSRCWRASSSAMRTIRPCPG